MDYPNIHPQPTWEEKMRYMVNGETVRGEPRIYWVEDRYHGHKVASGYSTDRRQAQRWCDRMNAEHLKTVLAQSAPPRVPV